MQLKIGILIEKLNKGGAERSAGLLSTILSDLGHDVYIITIFDDIKYPYKGELINIGSFKNTSGSLFNKLNRYWQLRKQLKHHDFDTILDFRIKQSVLRELALNLIVFNPVQMINMVRSYNIDWYFPQPFFVSRYIYKKYLSINTVSLEIKKRIEDAFSFKNVDLIYSPIDIEQINIKSQEALIYNEDFIVAVGRLEPVKQFDKLLKAYTNTVLPRKNIKLVILGSGSKEEDLKILISKLKLEDYVRLLPFTENPFNFMKHAKFSVLASANEGFPRALIESLACGTPVVSFNCKSGPSEIITNKENGLLVKNQDFTELKVAMDLMTENTVLYNHCKTNAKASIERYKLESIKDDWLSFLNTISLKINKQI